MIIICPQYYYDYAFFLIYQNIYQIQIFVVYIQNIDNENNDTNNVNDNNNTCYIEMIIIEHVEHKECRLANMEYVKNDIQVPSLVTLSVFRKTFQVYLFVGFEIYFTGSVGVFPSVPKRFHNEDSQAIVAIP